MSAIARLIQSTDLCPQLRPPDIKDLIKERQNRQEQLTKLRNRHAQLVEMLGTLGTIVSIKHTEENDRGSVFTRGSQIKVIFPPQEDVELTRQAYPAGRPHRQYGLLRVERGRPYDPTRVDGLLCIEYDDSLDAPYMRVVDRLGSSALPVGVLEAIDTAFEDLPTLREPLRLLAPVE
jgi:hypothetical protein